MKVLCTLLFCMMIPIPGLSQDVVTVLRQELERTAEQRDQARKEFLEMQTEAESQIRELSGTQLELSHQLETASKSLLELEAEAGRSTAALRRAEEELATRDEALSQLQQEVARNLQELQTLRARPESDRNPEVQQELEQTIQTLQRELESAIQSRDQALADRGTLEKLNAELRESLRSTQRAESLSNAKLAALESRLDNLNEELARLYQERSDLEQEQERLKGVISGMETRIADMEENRVPRAELQALEEALSAAREENQALKREMEERGAVPDLRVAFAAMERERDLLQAKQKMLSSKVSTLEQSLQQERNLRREEQEFRRGAELELSREKQQRRDLEKEIRKLQSGLAAATAAGVDQGELAEVSMLLEDLQEENRLLRQQSTQNREEVDRLMSELTDTDSLKTTQIRELQTMLGEQMIQLTAAQRKIDSLEAKTITLDSVRRERDTLIQVRDSSRQDMKVLARHIYELREQLVESRKIQHELKASEMEQQKLRQAVQKQQRLTEALQAEQVRKDQQILDLRRRLAAEADSESGGRVSP